MEPEGQQLHMYGAPTIEPRLPWASVDAQLTEAGVYWVVPAANGHPHARPVWGVWDGDALHLSIGSPTVLEQVGDGRPTAVHLGGALDVVILEGSVTGTTSEQRLVDRYNAKYEWAYSVEHYGPFRTFSPTTVLAWRSAGRDGRDGFQESGRWNFPT